MSLGLGRWSLLGRKGEGWGGYGSCLAYLGVSTSSSSRWIESRNFGYGLLCVSGFCLDCLTEGVEGEVVVDAGKKRLRQYDMNS